MLLVAVRGVQEDRLCPSPPQQQGVLLHGGVEAHVPTVHVAPAVWELEQQLDCPWAVVCLNQDDCHTWGLQQGVRNEQRRRSRACYKHLQHPVVTDIHKRLTALPKFTKRRGIPALHFTAWFPHELPPLESATHTMLIAQTFVGSRVGHALIRKSWLLRAATINRSGKETQKCEEASKKGNVCVAL